MLEPFKPFFAHIFARFYSLNELTLIDERQSQSADLSFPENLVVYDGHNFYFIISSSRRRSKMFDFLGQI